MDEILKQLAVAGKAIFEAKQACAAWRHHSGGDTTVLAERHKDHLSRAIDELQECETPLALAEVLVRRSFR